MVISEVLFLDVSDWAGCYLPEMNDSNEQIDKLYF